MPILTAIVNVMGGKDFIETHYLSILAQKERFKTAFIGRQAYFWHGKEKQMMELVYKYISFCSKIQAIKSLKSSWYPVIFIELLQQPNTGEV